MNSFPIPSSPPGAVSPATRMLAAGMGLLGYGVPDLASLDTALKALGHGGDALKSLALHLGFKPPSADTLSAQVMTGWLEPASGRVFIAPDSGWQPPSSAWKALPQIRSEWVEPYLPKPILDAPDAAGHLPDREPIKPEPPVASNPDHLPADPPTRDMPDGVPGGEREARPQDPPPPDVSRPPFEDAWQVARELTDDEWLSLRDALTVLREGRDAVAELADTLGFKPPLQPVSADHVLIGWLNESTGEIFIAPGAGWTPSDESWQVVAKLPLGAGRPPVDPLDDPHGHDEQSFDDDRETSDGRVDDEHDGQDSPQISVDPSMDAGDVTGSGGRPDEPPVSVDSALDARTGISTWLHGAMDSIRLVGGALKAGEPVEARFAIGQDPDASGVNTHIEVEWRIGDKKIEGATGMKLPAMPLLAGREVTFKMSLADSDGLPETITRSLASDETAKLASGRLMHWTKVLAEAAGARSADGRVAEAVDGQSGASTDSPGLREIDRADRFEVEGVDLHRFAVRATAQPASADGVSVSAADVLATLKLSHGRRLRVEPDDPDQTNSAGTDPFQLIAADIDCNGVVDRHDAQAILDEALDRGHAGAKQRWLFVPERAELGALSRQSVTWQEPGEAESNGQTQNWIGVILGDIDGSWKADLSAPTY